MNDVELQEKLKKIIDTVGNGWQEIEDAGFWYEADLQARLLNLLWLDGDLSFRIDLDERQVKLPSAHANIPMVINTRMHFDLGIFSETVIKEFAQRIRHIRGVWAKELANQPMLVAIQIEHPPGNPWSPHVCYCLHQIRECMQKGQIVKYGYLLIFYDARYGPNWMDVESELATERAKLAKEQDIKVYFAPCGDISAKGRWK